MPKSKILFNFGTTDADYREFQQVITRKIALKTNSEVTFKKFAKLMQKRRRTLNDLVDMFRGRIEEPREFFERVLSCKYKYEDRSSVVIPYRSVLQFYYHELHYLQTASAASPRPLKKTGTDS
jgi:hypothetical protein